MGHSRWRLDPGGLFPVILGLGLAAVILVGDQPPYLGLTPVPSAPPAAAIDVATPQPTAKPTASPTIIPDPRPTTPAVATANTPVPTASPTPRPYAAPVRLQIPAIGVDAPIVNVGLKADGQLESPHEPYQVGWYAKGYKPGERGNALIDGHVDWITGAAVFWYLNKLEKGAKIDVVTAEGEIVSFVVDWKAIYPAATAPLDQIFGPTESAALTLITCGGQFDRTSQSYTHRWVVRAVPAPGN